MKNVFGITGRMGVGKSTTIENLSEIFLQNGETLTQISIDEIRRDILRGAEGYEDIRISLAKQFSLPLQNKEQSLDIKDVAQAVFSTSEGPNIFWEIMGESILSRTEQAINEANGYVVLEWARLIEDGFLPLVNNNVIVVSCDDDVLMHRFKETDLPQEQIQARLANQMQTEVLIEQLKQMGITPILFDTTHNPKIEDYADLYGRIRHDLIRLAA